MLSPSDLLAFEDDIAQEFARGRIRAPIHLGGGNEKQLINLFADVAPDDWILAGWRSHYHCLLRGVPPDQLKAAIMGGRSVSLCFPDYKILCSGIVGGIAPIATGLAWAIKERGDTNRVWVFLGDMSAESGIVHEAMKYASRHCLPINWIVEDNGKSVGTDTQASWGKWSMPAYVERYRYVLTRPHAGINKWVRF